MLDRAKFEKGQGGRQKWLQKIRKRFDVEQKQRIFTSFIHHPASRPYFWATQSSI
jgi:hypothetical protein